MRDELLLPRHLSPALQRWMSGSLLLGLLLVGSACGDEQPEAGPAASPAPATDPATASEDDPASPPLFVDISRAAGLDFVSRNGARGDKLLPETMGGGCAFLDHDQDGDADILLVGGAEWAGAPNAQQQPSSLALYENDGGQNGGAASFTDVSEAAGLARSLHGMGPAVGDADGDGDDDLYITALGPNVYFRNEGGYFVDATQASGTAGPADAWSSAAGFFDADADGDLDLLCGNYIQWSRELDLADDRQVLGIPGRAYAPPMSFAGVHPQLYINRGDGVFDEGAAEAGLHIQDSDGSPLSKTLAYHFADLDGDFDTDVFVSNDTVRNFLFINDGAGVFSEQGTELGLAYDRMGRPTGAMGVDGGLLPDGRQALFVANFADEMSSAYLAGPTGDYFEDDTLAVGLGRESRSALSFGLLFLDIDLDGWRDVLQVNGHLEPSIGEAPGDQTYAQAAQLFLGQPTQATQSTQAGGMNWLPQPATRLGDLALPVPGRGVAAADIDADGDLDLLMTQVNGPARLLLNTRRSAATQTTPYWLRVQLKGRPGFASALGAELQLTAAGHTQHRTVDSTRGYLSQSERSLHFGLGDTSGADSLHVRWPDGSESHVDLGEQPLNRTLTVVQAVSPEQVQRQLNHAKAELEAGRVGPALASLRRALDSAPESAPTWRNLARAQMIANDPEAALASLDRADGLEAGQLASRWIRAMAELRLDRPAVALPLIDEVIRRDPQLAAARFQRAKALQALGRDAEALPPLREAVALDMSHAAAQFQLAVASRRAGDMEGFRTSNRDFLRLRSLFGDAYDTPVALEACWLTKAEDAGTVVPSATGRLAPSPTLSLQFTEPSGAVFGALDDVVGVAILSMNAQGRYVLLSAHASGQLQRLDPTPEGGFTGRVVATGLGDLSKLAGLCVGNVFDDTPVTLQPGSVPPRQPDVFLYGPDVATLLQQDAEGNFQDVTERAGLGSAFATRALWVDHEHDGDLDLVLASSNGLQTFVNQNNGRFEPSPDMPDLNRPSRDLVAVDFDDNGAVDFALATQAGTERVDNLRVGRFALHPNPPGPWPAAQRILSEDLDLDGHADVVLIHAHGVQFVFDGVPGVVQELPDVELCSGTFIDPDGDGWLDLALVGRPAADAPGSALQGPQVRMLRNAGRATWTDWTAACGLDTVWASSQPPGQPTGPSGPGPELLAADLDGDGDSDLLLRSDNGSLHLLQNQGGHDNPLLKLQLLSLMSPSGALGARVEVRSGDFYTSRMIQSEQPVELGVGGRGTLDSVLAVWPYGVVDTRTDVLIPDDHSPVPLIVLEKADTGSCPFLYIWDGEQKRFISDVVGSGATDLPLSREELMPVNPHELVSIGPARDFPLVNGAWEISLTSELREVAYFDEAALLVVDHPEGTELASTHRMRGPPFPEDRVLALGRPIPLRSAQGDDGLDRTDALRERDTLHAPPGPLLPPPLRGVCQPMSLELDFGPLDTSKPLVLNLSGYIEFGTASTLIAQSQRDDVLVQWPELEARDGDGKWQRVDTIVGIPGGKSRDLTIELDGLLPEGADRLRLSTTFQLHWDRAALFEQVPLAASAVTELRPGSARLQWRGFSELVRRGPTQARSPDYTRVSQQPPWRMNLTGWATRYGDVLPLLQQEDGKIIVLTGGDELLLQLPAASLGPLAAGQQRTLLWRSVGYNKEADPNNAGGGHIWPLGPDTTYGRSDAQEDAWRLEWNTRWVPAGRFDPFASGTR